MCLGDGETKNKSMVYKGGIRQGMGDHEQYKRVHQMCFERGKAQRKDARTKHKVAEHSEESDQALV